MVMGLGLMEMEVEVEWNSKSCDGFHLPLRDNEVYIPHN